MSVESSLEHEVENMSDNQTPHRRRAGAARQTENWNDGRERLSPASPFSNADTGGSWSGERWEHPATPESAYIQRTWDEVDYPPSEPTAKPSRAAAANDRDVGASPYARPAWDKENDLPDARPTDGAYGRDAYAPTPLYFDADADTSPSAARRNSAAARPNPYARPAEEPAGARSERFAPPVRLDGRASAPQEPPVASPKPSPNVYHTQKNRGEETARTRGDAYRVEAETPSGVKPKKHRLRRLLIALLVLALLGSVAYLERDWLTETLAPLFGGNTLEMERPSAQGAQQPTTLGYDPAPSLTISDKAKKGINAVAGKIGLKAFAVTASNIVARTATGNGVYDYYLFAAADGKLLGYYEGLSANDFLVCPDDIFYANTSPYLMNAQGRALFSTGRYVQSVGEHPVLGPMINGWALICDADYTTYNYLDSKGDAISSLWFSQAYPFTADSTLAYVDTGNLADTENRYALYVLSQDGSETLWKHAPDMSGVLGCACGVACLSDGELILLNAQRTVLCQTDDVAVYADCGAVVARDAQSGQYGLFVNGEQHYDFAYDSIAPVASPDIDWQQETHGFYKLYTVSGSPYPLPLSHYFQLKKGEQTELVALSTASVYPLRLSLQP
jgi:hypothetical protein